MTNKTWMIKEYATHTVQEKCTIILGMLQHDTFKIFASCSVALLNQEDREEEIKIGVELNKLFRFIIQLAIAIHGTVSVVVRDGSHGFGHNEVLLHFLLCLKEGIQCQQPLHPLGFLLLCIPIIPQTTSTNNNKGNTDKHIRQDRGHMHKHKKGKQRKKERKKEGKKGEELSDIDKESERVRKRVKERRR